MLFKLIVLINKELSDKKLPTIRVLINLNKNIYYIFKIICIYTCVKEKKSL